MSDDTPQEEENQCPVCGQPYDHKRTESNGMSPTIRNDATECKTARIAGERTVYVHVGSKRVTNVVKRTRDGEEYEGPIRRLFS